MNIFDLLFGGGSPSVNAEELAKMISEKQNDFVVIDVRTKGEWNDGHIKGAVHIPLNTIQSKADFIKKKYQGKKKIMICRSGSRSGTATDMLINAGLEDVYNFSGGMIAWNRSGAKVA